MDSRNLNSRTLHVKSLTNVGPDHVTSIAIESNVEGTDDGMEVIDFVDLLSNLADGFTKVKAAMKSLFHALKIELTHHCRYKTRTEASHSLLEYIEVFYNQPRMYSTLNYMTPVEFESYNALTGGISL